MAEGEIKKVIHLFPFTHTNKPSNTFMSLESRLVAACVCDWVHSVVVPKWKLHAIRMHQSLRQIERDIVSQAGKGTDESRTKTHHSTELQNEENQLLFPVKITCAANMVNGTAIRQQPHVIGIEGFDQLLLQYLNPIAEKVPVPIVDYVKENEWTNRTAGKRQIRWRHKALLGKSMFKNALGEYADSQGFKYSNSLGSICIFSKYRLITFEQYITSPTPSGEIKAAGGVNIMFVNPKYSINAIKLLQTMLQNTKDFEYKERPLNILKRFCQLMTVFLFPTSSVQIYLQFNTRHATEIEEYFGIFHPENHRDVTFEEEAHHGSVKIFCYKTTSSKGNCIHVKTIKYHTEKYEIMFLSSGAPNADTDIITLPVISYPFYQHDSQQNEICSWYVQTERDIHLVDKTIMDYL
jgi:hypothetical protein